MVLQELDDNLKALVHLLDRQEGHCLEKVDGLGEGAVLFPEDRQPFLSHIGVDGSVEME